MTNLRHIIIAREGPRSRMGEGGSPQTARAQDEDVNICPTTESGDDEAAWVPSRGLQHQYRLATGLACSMFEALRSEPFFGSKHGGLEATDGESSDEAHDDPFQGKPMDLLGWKSSPLRPPNLSTPRQMRHSEQREFLRRSQQQAEDGSIDSDDSRSNSTTGFL